MRQYALAQVSAFTPLISTLAHRYGEHRATEVIVLGDGAAWIWQIAASQFPGAVQILDYFHVLQRLHLIATTRFGEESAEAKEWVSAREAELGEDRVSAVLAAIAAWKPRSAEKRQLRASQWSYFASQAERMR